MQWTICQNAGRWKGWPADGGQDQPLHPTVVIVTGNVFGAIIGYN